MSSSYIEKLALTILSGQANSNAIIAAQIQDAAAIGIISPATLDGGHTFVIEVNVERDASGNWAILKDRDGNNSYVPVQDTAAWYPELVAFPAFRIRDTTGNVAADRAFTIIKHHTI